MKAPDSKVAVSLGKLSMILKNQNLIEDSDLFDQVVSVVAKKHIILDTPPKEKSIESRIESIDRLVQDKKRQEKLESLRKQLNFEKNLEVTGKPAINPKSKEIVMPI